VYVEVNQKDTTSANDTNDVSRIEPERALQQIAADHDYTVDALRAAVREDLRRNQRMADRILEHRPVVHRDDDYLVVRAHGAVSEETAIPVLDVYRWMDDSDTDYASGYALVVPTTDDAGECPHELEFENAAERRGDGR
jgi:hypothetical protein